MCGFGGLLSYVYDQNKTGILVHVHIGLSYSGAIVVLSDISHTITVLKHAFDLPMPLLYAPFDYLGWVTLLQI